MSISDPDYLDTKELKLGNKKLDPIFIELTQWIASHCGVMPVNIFCDQSEVGSALMSFKAKVAVRYFLQKVLNRASPPVGGTRVMVILKDQKDLDAFNAKDGINFNRSFQQKIARKFIELAQKYKLENQYNLKSVFVVFSEFRSTYFSEVILSIPDAQRDKIIEREYGPPIWEIHQTDQIGLMICTYQESQIELLSRSPLIDQLKQEYFEMVRPFDWLNLITLKDINISFFSKEKLDSRYDGNWEYFYRG